MSLRLAAALVCLTACGGRVARERAEPKAAPVAAPAPAFVKVADPESLATIDAPVLVTAAEAAYADAEPVVGIVTPSGEPRGYSLWQLERTPIVNDTDGGFPFAIVFDPVSRTAAAFVRPSREATLGVSGLLHAGALVVHDRASATMFGVLTGAALAGERLDQRLVEYPSVVLPAAWWRALRPATRLLRRDPVQGFLSDRWQVESAEAPGGLSAAALVLGVRGGEAARAFPLATLSTVVNDEVGGLPVAIVPIGGSALAFVRSGEEGPLTFDARPDRLVDRETKTEWTFDGRAFAGPLAPRSLAAPPLARMVRWGAWKQAFPGTTLQKAD